MGPFVPFLLFFVMAVIIVIFIIYKVAKQYYRLRGTSRGPSNNTTATTLEIPAGNGQRYNLGTPTPAMSTAMKREILSQAISTGTVLVTSEEEIMGVFADSESVVQIEDTCCPICLVEYEHGEAICRSQSTCNHVFHQKCILEWLVKQQQKNECPCCRASFVDVVEPTAPPEQAVTTESGA